MSTLEVTETTANMVSVADGSGSIVPVPNGTLPVATCLSRVDELVEQYLMFAKKTAKATLDLAETVFIADRELGKTKTDLQEFCKRVGLNPKGSTYRKMRIVGRVRSRFDLFEDRLPNGWTSLAKMGSLPPDQFDRITSHKAFGPRMTGRDIDQIVGRKPSKRTQRFRRDPVTHKSLKHYCLVPFDAVETAVGRKNYDELVEFLESRGFKYTLSPELQETLDHFNYVAA